MSEGRRLERGEARSAGTNPQRRVPQPWPKDRRFRILSIDGGGIRGIFPATVLAALERLYTNGASIANYFDLVAGTSTGGILALGLGAGHTAAHLSNLYVERGGEIFPDYGSHLLGRVRNWLRERKHLAHYIYDRSALRSVLEDELGARLFGQSKVRLCIPAFEGKYSEVFVFKTPHHEAYQTDRYETMVTVGLATAAAPTYFRSLEQGGYVLVDGGVWANNPILLAVIEALTCFDVERDQIDVLSLGCGEDKYTVTGSKISWGGQWHWRDAINPAMRLQSLAATNQARLLLGLPSVIRIDAPTFKPELRMDDWRRAVRDLVPSAHAAFSTNGTRIAEMFLRERAVPFFPTPET